MKVGCCCYLLGTAHSEAVPWGGCPTPGYLLLGQEWGTDSLWGRENRECSQGLRPPSSQRAPPLRHWEPSELLLVQDSCASALFNYRHNCPLPSECFLSEPNPGQAFLDIPREEGVMYNTELFEVMGDFYLAEWYKNAFKLRWKHKLLLAELNICTLWTSLPVSLIYLPSWPRQPQWVRRGIEGVLTIPDPLLSSAHLLVSWEPLPCRVLLISHTGGKGSPRSSAFWVKWW